MNGSGIIGENRLKTAFFSGFDLRDLDPAPSRSKVMVDSESLCLGEHFCRWYRGAMVNGYGDLCKKPRKNAPQKGGGRLLTNATRKRLL